MPEIKDKFHQCITCIFTEVCDLDKEVDEKGLCVEYVEDMKSEKGVRV